MFVEKNFTLKGMWRFSGGHFIWIASYIGLIVCLFVFTDIRIPFISWLPISVIGTAVAFYLGFKNNQAYDRLWEARKIWGGIVNYSRTWGMNVKGFIHEGDGLHKIHQRMIYRHIAWLYALRGQLLIPTEWEHIKSK